MQVELNAGGPHEDICTVAAADAAVQAIRVLTQAATPAAGGVTMPATVFETTGSLSEAAWGQPQLARQLLTYLEAAHAAGRLRFPRDSDAAAIMARLRVAAGRVEQAARALGDAWGAMQDAVTLVALKEADDE